MRRTVTRALLIGGLAAGLCSPFVTPAAQLQNHKRAKLDAHFGSYYVRLALEDKPGVMAAIAKRMGDRGISLESIVQHRPQSAAAAASRAGASKIIANVIIITHETTEEAMRKALETIEKDGKVAERPQMIRIDEL